MTINLQIPQKFNIKPTITVFGVGGAGGNAVNNMVSSGLDGVKFVVANTDAQSLDNSLIETRVQLGETITQGLGAGSYPEVGKAAAEETAEAIIDIIQDSNMVFITAGMGGGTGTGAAPVIARLAREQGILTVAVVTKPFHFEGSHRMRVAELGLQELQKYVDTLVVIPNQNLFRVADKNTTFADAFRMADEVLNSGIRGITDLMVMPGLINLDFADIRSVMSEMGKAMMGAGEASGESRASEAAEAAISNPLLDNVSMKGAKGVLINITGGSDLTLFEVDEAANRIREEVDPDANIIFGSTFDEGLKGKIRVSIVATGIDSEQQEAGANKAQTNSAAGSNRFVKNQPAAVDSRSAASASASASAPSYSNSESENEDSDKSFFSPQPVEADLDSVSANDESSDEDVQRSRDSDRFSEDEESERSRGIGFFGRRSSPERTSLSVEEDGGKDDDVVEEISSRADRVSISSRRSDFSRPAEVSVPEKPKVKKSDSFLDIPAFNCTNKNSPAPVSLRLWRCGRHRGNLRSSRCGYFPFLLRKNITSPEHIADTNEATVVMICDTKII